MTWFRIDDGLGGHPKVRAIPRARRRAVMGTWALVGAWCSGQLTDGRLTLDNVVDEGGTRADAVTLVEVRLWHGPGWPACDHLECPTSQTPAGPGEFVYHDWWTKNPTREQVLAERAAAADRQRRGRERQRAKRAAEEADRDTSHGDSHAGSHAVTSAERHAGSHTGSHGGPDPTRPDPTRSTASGHLSSSPGLPEREPTSTDDDGPPIEQLAELGAGRLPAPALRAEAAAFRAHNAGRWGDVHDVRRAWSGWLAKAVERRKPTPTPSDRTCPVHPDQPGGAKACPRCVAEATPSPDVRKLAAEVTQ